MQGTILAYIMQGMSLPLLFAAHYRCRHRRCCRCRCRSSFPLSLCLPCFCCLLVLCGWWIHVPRPCGRRYVTCRWRVRIPRPCGRCYLVFAEGSATASSPGCSASTSPRPSALRYAQTAFLPDVVGAIGCTFSGIHHRGCPTCKSLRVPTVTSLHASAAAVAAALPLCSIQNVPRIIAPQRPLSDPTDGGGYQDERETP